MLFPDHRRYMEKCTTRHRSGLLEDTRESDVKAPIKYPERKRKEWNERLTARTNKTKQNKAKEISDKLVDTACIVEHRNCMETTAAHPK